MNWSLTLPDGRALTIDETIRDRLSCGVLVFDGVLVRDEPAVAAETGRLAEQLRAAHAGKQPARIEGLAEARALYKSFGVDPSRHRPSSEALLRRVLKGQSLYRISNAVDACNLNSLRALLPVGMYDLDRIEGDIVLRTGREGEEYPGIRKGMVHLAGRLGLFDAAGPFGSPTSDSARTSVQEPTRRILAVVMATRNYDPQRMAGHLAEFARSFACRCDADRQLEALLGPAAPDPKEEA